MRAIRSSFVGSSIFDTSIQRFEKSFGNYGLDNSAMNDLTRTTEDSTESRSAKGVRLICRAMLGLERLRLHAISHSLFPQTTLKAAIRRLGFVQADPIRSPARAQDLILRHRVKGYRAGDLERRYASLDIEEDTLYAYGFLPRTIWQLLHPRNIRG